MEALVINIICFLLSGVYYEIGALPDLHDNSLFFPLFNIVYGVISLNVILLVLYLLTRSSSSGFINTFCEWKDYVIMHVAQLFFYKFTIDLSVYLNANNRLGIGLIVAIIGNAFLQFLFITILSFWGIKGKFPQVISLSKFRFSFFCLLSCVSLIAAFAGLYQGEISDFFSFLLISYTSLSVSVSLYKDPQ